MSVKTRSQLKAIFTAGATPVQADFDDLIDSCNNRRGDLQWDSVDIANWALVTGDVSRNVATPAGRLPRNASMTVWGDNGIRYFPLEELILTWNPATEQFTVNFGNSTFVDSLNFSSGTGTRVRISYLYFPV